MGGLRRVLQKTVVFALLGLIQIGVPVRADMVTQTQSQDLDQLALLGTPATGPTYPHTVGTDLQTQVPATPISFNKFDPSLGTLTSVTLDLSGVSMYSDFSAGYGNANGTTTITQEVLNASASLTVPGSLLPGGMSQSIQDTFGDAQGNPSYYAFNPPEHTLTSSNPSYSVSQTASIVASQSNPTLTLTGSQVASFVGPGTFMMSFKANAKSTHKAGNGISSQGIFTYVKGHVDVVYTYGVITSVPEPASLLLLGLGTLVVLPVAVARQRQRQRQRGERSLEAQAADEVPRSVR